MPPHDILVRERLNLAEWMRKIPSFTERTPSLFLQSRVVFYPGSGDDGHPIKLFGSSGAASCFVYADQLHSGYGRDPTGYKPVRQDLVCWPEVKRPFKFDGKNPKTAQWTIFQRQEGYGPDHGHELIALLYVFGEAFTVYWDLWARNGKAPYAILVVDHGLGGNCTGRLFGGDRSPLYEWAEHKRAWPDWLLVSELGMTRPWPGYHRVSKGDRGGMHNDQRFLYSRNQRNSTN